MGSSPVREPFGVEGPADFAEAEERAKLVVAAFVERGARLLRGDGKHRIVRVRPRSRFEFFEIREMDRLFLRRDPPPPSLRLYERNARNLPSCASFSSTGMRERRSFTRTATGCA